MKEQPFVTTAIAQPSYRLGDPILITFEIENISSENYQVLTSGTPFERSFTRNCLVVQVDGERIPYDGRLVKRGDPPAEAYSVIGPGERLSSTVDISQAYVVDRVGDYTVTLDTAFLDAFHVPGKAKAGPRKRQDHEMHKLPTATVQFKVLAGTEPKLTSGQMARKAEKEKKLAKSSAKEPTFNGGTASEQADTVIAHNNAQYFCALAAEQLTAGPDSSNALYQTWYGSFDQDRYDKVPKDYNDISSTLLTEQVTYDLTCDSSDFAYTWPGVRTVWLCKAYRSAPQIGTDCKFGTLVHEWSHAICDTDDYVYGESGCQTLATDHPDEAVDNADSHEYFAEHNAQSDFGKNLTFITDRSTFGQDEIHAILQQSPSADIPAAFYIIADGFWPDKLGITNASLGNSPNVKPSFTVTPDVSGLSVNATFLQAEDNTLPVSPQRFTWVCQISFSSENGFPDNPGDTKLVTLTATLGGFSASGQILLIREPNPYELDGPTWWLSTDLRVFKIAAGESRFGETMGSDASEFIKNVINNLNSGNSGESFDDIFTDEQVSALELSQSVNGVNVFNFALAKVRYTGTTDISNVRVFFRLCPASTTSTTYDRDTTYSRAVNGPNTIPILGLNSAGDLLTIPCFAEPRIDSALADLTTQTDPANVQQIHQAGGKEAVAYFGCWLDINQTDKQFPTHPSSAVGPWSSGRLSVQQLIRNAHQCLLAEISFDPEPIPNAISPATSDMLAQRNLSLVASANPGATASHRIANTFEVRPTEKDPSPARRPDELMFDWGNLPVGSMATIYLPGLAVAELVQKAIRWSGSTPFSLVDDHTLQCRAEGIAFLPLPNVVSPGYVGLLDIDLPPTVKNGQVFKVRIRQLTNAVGAPPVVIEIAPNTEATEPQAKASTPLRWRRVAGAFQITIPVKAEQDILDSEERLLSNLRWIQEAIPAGDRWSPVFNKYVNQIADRVDALGGDSSIIEASASGPDVSLLLEILDQHGNFYNKAVDIDIKHRTLHDVPGAKVHNILASRPIPVKGLRRFPQSDYVVTVTPSAVFHPDSQFVTIPASGTPHLKFVFKTR